MRIRGIASIALALVLVVAMAAVAVADGLLTVTPAKMIVSYPRPAKMIITAPAALAETITVEARPVGGDWKAVKSIPAGAAALATTFTVNPKLRVTSGIRATQGTLVSEVVTISVKAKLSPVHVNRRKAVYTVKGTISPAHAKETVIGLHVWKKTGKGHDVVLTPMPDVTGTVYKSNKQVSWWKASFNPDGKGTFVVKAFHEDDGHILSVSKAKSFKVRH